MRAHYVAAIHLLLAFWAITGTPVIAAPIVEFETTSFDFGKPMEGEKAKAVFSFKNTGDADLEITQIRASCGCTNARTTETRIIPGRSASIEAVFNTAGYPGKVSKTVTVATNDPARSTVVLTIKGEVIPIAELKPQPYLNLGDMKPGVIILSDFVIVPRIEQQFRLIKVGSSGKQATMLAFDRRRNRTGNYALKIRIMAGHTLGRFYEQISIVTDLPGNPIIRFPIYGNIVSDAAAQTDKTQ